MRQYYVTMTDKFMSGWGMSRGRTNKLIIVCDTVEQAETIERNARKRSEMIYVNFCINKPSYPKDRYLTTWKAFSDMNGPWLDA
jgi:hypothetical protein